MAIDGSKEVSNGKKTQRLIQSDNNTCDNRFVLISAKINKFSTM